MAEPDATQAAPETGANVMPFRGQNVVAVASGKGGVGKTWFSITLTHALAAMGLKALLFDGDLGLANVDIQLGLMSRSDLGDVLDGRATLKGVVTTYDEGAFDIIAGRSGSGVLATVSGPQLMELRNGLLEVARTYDRVVLDIGAGVDRTARILAQQVGVTLILTNDEPTALTDAYAFIKVMHGLNANADMRVVVNMAASHREGERTYATIAKTCARYLSYEPQLAGIVRADPRVKDSIRAQMPLLLRSPGCDAAEDVERIARNILKPTVLAR